jgi:hypothetical protein
MYVKYQKRSFIRSIEGRRIIIKFPKNYRKYKIEEKIDNKPK